MFQRAITSGRQLPLATLCLFLSSLALIAAVVGCSSIRSPIDIVTTRRIPSIGKGAPGQYVVRASQYAFTTDFELERNDPLISDLESLQVLIGESLELRWPSTPIRIVIFNDRQSYHEFLAKNFPELPDRRAFFIQEGTDSRAIFASRGDRLAQDLRHEVTHALLHSALPDVPLWLDEGLAEYFESANQPGAVNAAHVQHLEQAAARGWKPDMARLEGMADLWQMRQEDYRESWLWIHFLMNHSPQTRQLIVDDVASRARGEQRLALSDRLLSIFPDPGQVALPHLAALAKSIDDGAPAGNGDVDKSIRGSAD